MQTPQLTNHARLRCIEMGVPTKIAKHIVMHAEVVYPGAPEHDNGACIYQWSGAPEYACCAIPGERPLILSVLFRTPVSYKRAGFTFTPKEGS